MCFRHQGQRLFRTQLEAVSASISLIWGLLVQLVWVCMHACHQFIGPGLGVPAVIMLCFCSEALVDCLLVQTQFCSSVSLPGMVAATVMCPELVAGGVVAFGNYQ
jgi:hypothetical protein